MNHPSAHWYHLKWQQTLSLAAQLHAVHTDSRLIAVQQKVVHVKEITFQFPFDIRY